MWENEFDATDCCRANVVCLTRVIDMEKNMTVAVLGFDEIELAIIAGAFPSDKIELFDTECASDLIAIDHIAIIVNVSRLDPGGLELLYAFYGEIEYFAESVILVGPTLSPPPDVGFKRYADFESLSTDLKYLLLSAFRQKKNSDNFSKKLAHAIMILSRIRSNPGITTRELAKERELSPRTVQRYIETLRVAGEAIDYDPVKKGWKLSAGKSFLWGDI